MTLNVDAFQMDERALMTVRDDAGELFMSGAFKTRRLSPGLMEIDFGDGFAMARITKTCDDPAKVGKPCRPGQIRFAWSGELYITEN
jgi:hypothetical protein